MKANRVSRLALACARCERREEKQNVAKSGHKVMCSKAFAKQ